MFPRSASSLENPQENCLKSYWPALMQFLMKMPPIIRLTGAGCYQWPWCWVQWSMTSPETPDGHHTADRREVTLLIGLSWAEIIRSPHEWAKYWCEWRNDYIWNYELWMISAAMMILSSASRGRRGRDSPPGTPSLPRVLIHYSRGRLPVPRSQMIIKIAALIG